MKTIKLLSGLLAAGTMTLAGVGAEISNPHATATAGHAARHRTYTNERTGVGQ